MKFSQMPYKRLGYASLSKELNKHLAAFKNAKSLDSAIAAYADYNATMANLGTCYSLAAIRNSMDTNDTFYKKEVEYWQNTFPKLGPIFQDFSNTLLQSQFRPQLEEKWGKLMFVNADIGLKTFDKAIIEDLQKESTLRQEYSELIASAQIEFDGKTLTLAQIRPYGENPDRAIRKAANDALCAWFNSKADTLDQLFDKLVHLRDGMAKKLGYKSFTELGYYRMCRNCYNEQMVATFRDGIKQHIVPVVNMLKAAQAKRIGVDTIKMYDSAFNYADGNPKPIGTVDEIFANTKKMYHELSSETGEFIDYMLQRELFDVLTRPGKNAGGYCSYLPNYKSPFIFANFNGTSGDIDVLTHEVGHAYAAYIAKDIFPSELQDYSNETAEVHSMSMEFFTWPWMKNFFGDSAKKYYNKHLSGALSFLPYGTMVDEFQHHIYANPNMSPAERNQLWLKLEKEYRPWLDLSDTPFYGDGRRWQEQLHIYLNPFYYIDYCLAQTIALSFWSENQKEPKNAFTKYRRFLGFAGTKTFVELVEDAGMPSPFNKDNLKPIADTAVDWLDKNKL